MAGDEQKKSTRGRKKTAESEEPKQGARSRTSSARSTTAAEPKGRPAAKSAAKGTTKAAKGDPSTPPAASKSAPRTTGAKPAGTRAKRTEPTEREFREPGHDEIAQRAYEVWRRTGNEDALENWIQAERELRGGNREDQG